MATASGCLSFIYPHFDLSRWHALLPRVTPVHQYFSSPGCVFTLKEMPWERQPASWLLLTFLKWCPLAIAPQSTTNHNPFFSLTLNSSWRIANEHQNIYLCEAFIINKNSDNKKKIQNRGAGKTLPFLTLWNTSSWLKMGCTTRRQLWIRNESENSAQYCFWQPLFVPEQCNALLCWEIMLLGRPPEHLGWVFAGERQMVESEGLFHVKSFKGKGKKIFQLLPLKHTRKLYRINNR